jgi:hypothetical protein
VRKRFSRDWSALINIDYVLVDASVSEVVFDISSDYGSTWSVVDYTHSGDIGLFLSSGSHSFTWNAVIDFPDKNWILCGSC